jgi:dTDP-4-amino-4,6-dideoxygalactose transaminase
MTILKFLARAGYHQLKNLGKVASGRPLTLPSLSSMTLDEDDVQLAQAWLEDRHTWYQTDEVKEYETRFAAWNGSAYAFSFMGGRVALSAIIHALGLEPGDEVILPGYTCVVVPNAFHYAGIKTVYSDIELETYGLDAALIGEKITPKTRAILLIHLYGLVCRDYDKIISIARSNDLYLIEDCAHSTGAEYKGRRVGNSGDAAFFSSEQSKVFTTIQGGLAVTNDKVIAAKIREYREQAAYPDEKWIERQLKNVILRYYRFKHPQRWWRGDLAALRLRQDLLVSTTQEEEQGVRPAHYGRRMPAPVAALGLNQLAKIDRYNAERRKTAERWDRWCEEHGYPKPLILADSKPVFLRYPVLVEPEKKRDLGWGIRELGVGLGVWFVSNVHPAQRTVEGCPNADKAVRCCINFPTLGVK